ncbi:GspE/PulE family protein [Ruminococcaceae bacterium OttesenSCG-928-I18]|nr:GspE/PulE family protein [Ruminococcaceae bacterium OttesenSCG-928-I18]
MSSNLDTMKRVRLGEVLIAQCLITQAQLEQALSRQQQDRSKRLGDILVEMGFVSEQQKLEALSKRLDIPLIHFETYPVDVMAVEKIPRETADKYKVIAIGFQRNELLVAVNDPLNFFAIEDVRQVSKMPVTLCLAEVGEIDKAIGYYYSEAVTRRADPDANLAVPMAEHLEDIAADPADDAPIVKLLHSLLLRGFGTHASDIHIEPFADHVNVRIRVDGAIVDYTQLRPDIHPPLIARIKMLANLDIAEKQTPQDGRFRVLADGTDLHIRVSLVPTVHGEKAVLHFLNTYTDIDRADTFGMSEEDHAKVLAALRAPQGMIYLTGPAGSGKTTSLYMMLESLAKRQLSIASIEDPVERSIAHINQIQVNPAAGLSFHTGLRALLRQDPDILMVGETSDAETAALSLNAAIQGKLVLSALHTNDAVGSITRLRDMGIPPYLLAGSLVCIIAQRLVRKICPDCAHMYEIPDSEKPLVPQGTTHVKRGKGCQHCHFTGYRGRIAVHEILLVDKTMRGMITSGASEEEMFHYTHTQQKMKTLRESATELLLAGVTSVEELMKIVSYEKWES